jgi:tubulin--tyrosine ligase
MESTRSGKRTCIVQKYIHNPLLVNKRKFDIRVFTMISSINGHMKGYFFDDMYFRTSCKEFSLVYLANRFIHLTNDAVQKKSEDYGKFENGNKFSVNDFQKYLDLHHSELSINWTRDLLP